MEDSRYKELISELINQFETTIPPEDDYREDLIKGFTRCLDQERNRLSQNLVIKSSQFLMKRGLKACARQLMDADITTKKKRLVKDESFEKLKKESDRYFELAKETLIQCRSVVDDFDLEQVITDLKKLAESVKPFNKEAAKWLLSESIVDVNFIDKPGINVSSVRLGEVYDQLPDKQKAVVRYFIEMNHGKYLKEKKGAPKKRDHLQEWHERKQREALWEKENSKQANNMGGEER